MHCVLAGCERTFDGKKKKKGTRAWDKPDDDDDETKVMD